MHYIITLLNMEILICGYVYLEEDLCLTLL